MRDERGVYYHPQPGNSHVRMYVRNGIDGEVEFRMWESEHPEVWDRHPWLPMAVICDAADLYKTERNEQADPLKLYDLDVARALLRESNA